jgi:hypothetical protein
VGSVVRASHRVRERGGGFEAEHHSGGAYSRAVAGIRPVDVPGFLTAQAAGAVAASGTEAGVGPTYSAGA